MNLIKLTILNLLFCSVGFKSIGKTMEMASSSSPDKKIRTEIFLKKDNSGTIRLYYTVSYRDKPVILQSELGIGLWSKDMSVVRTVRSKHSSSWKPLYAEQSSIKDEYTETVVTLSRPGTDAQLEVFMRTYDEGVALRYRVVAAQGGSTPMPITTESTQFTFPDATKAWFEPTVESPYKCLPLSNWPGKSEGPLTLSLPRKLYVCLGEAAQINYPITRYSIQPEEPNRIYSNLASSVPYGADGSLNSPWRYILIGEKPGDLLEHNYLVLNLNAPIALKNTGWIKPGKIIRETSLSSGGCKKLIDFANAHHVQYILLDAGWYGQEYKSRELSDATRPKTELDLPEVLAYAKKKNVGVWLYVNRIALESQLDEILPLYEKWGVAGIKFGFVRFGTFDAMSWLQKAIRKCADHHLMVNIHDEYRPSGYTRTFPNLLIQEGVRGNEQFPDATSNVTLPFTRFIAGPADYTICYYSDKIKTTRAHQLAMAAVYYTPLQTLYWYDRPYAFEAGAELEFWDKIPTVWDETKVLQGDIGAYITVARRSGSNWFLGTLTNNEPRSLTIDLDFLDPGKKYTATIFAEDNSGSKAAKTAVKITKFIVTSASNLPVRLASSGGQAIMIEPLNPRSPKSKKGLLQNQKGK